MPTGYAGQAIKSVLNSEKGFCKFLSANDTGATGGHQSGILISKSAVEMMFRRQELAQVGIPKRTVKIKWQDDFETESCFTYYESKNELRITRFGRGFPFLKPEQTGALFVFIKQTDSDYSGYFLEYTLFRALEYARYGEIITKGFQSVDEFVRVANVVLNRRKSRAGKSLEHHLAAIFDGNCIEYSSQAVTEGNKKPDFLFPSKEAYHDYGFSVDNIISLAAKTTCKDRWRQVLNEADRLRDKPKYLCTLQQGISGAQMDEMQAENVILVVPKPYIVTYPKDRRDRIWTLARFVQYVKMIEGASPGMK